MLPRDPGVVRDRDLFTELTALIMPIIPPIVAMVCSTHIHPFTAPDGYERKPLVGVVAAEVEL